MKKNKLHFCDVCEKKKPDCKTGRYCCLTVCGECRTTNPEGVSEEDWGAGNEEEEWQDVD
jgi:hypothetical protein